MDLKEYLPPFYSGWAEIDASLDACSEIKDDEYNLANAVLSNMFVLKCDFGRVREFENLLELPENNSLTTEQRRERIIYFLANREPYNLKYLQDMINADLPLTFTVSQDCVAEELYITPTDGSTFLPWDMYQAIEYLLVRCVPIHVGAYIPLRAQSALYTGFAYTEFETITIEVPEYNDDIYLQNNLYLGAPLYQEDAINLGAV